MCLLDFLADPHLLRTQPARHPCPLYAQPLPLQGLPQQGPGILVRTAHPLQQQRHRSKGPALPAAGPAPRISVRRQARLSVAAPTAKSSCRASSATCSTSWLLSSAADMGLWATATAAAPQAHAQRAPPAARSTAAPAGRRRTLRCCRCRADRLPHPPGRAGRAGRTGLARQPQAPHTCQTPAPTSAQ